MNFRPTYLYIKQHTITGKLYFGKTVRNPETYIGSGVRWLNHVKKHGTKHVDTLWYCLFYDREELTKFALSCSKQWNIVESENWLNMKEENGLDGCHPGSTFSEETKEKMRAVKRTDEFKANLRRPNDATAKKVVIEGKEFRSCLEAAKFHNVASSTLSLWIKKGKAIIV